MNHRKGALNRIYFIYILQKKGKEKTLTDVIGLFSQPYISYV